MRSIGRESGVTKMKPWGFLQGLSVGGSVFIRFKFENWVFDFIWHISIVHKKPPNFSLALLSSVLPHTHLFLPALDPLKLPTYH